MANECGSADNLLDCVANSTVRLATPSSTGTKGIHIVPKRRFQKGTFVKRTGNWVGMWRVDVMQRDSTINREQRSKTFVGLSERAARAAFQPILDRVNAANGATPPVPEGGPTQQRHSRMAWTRGGHVETQHKENGGIALAETH